MSEREFGQNIGCVFPFVCFFFSFGSKWLALPTFRSAATLSHVGWTDGSGHGLIMTPFRTTLTTVRSDSYTAGLTLLLLLGLQSIQHSCKTLLVSHFYYHGRHSRPYLPAPLLVCIYEWKMSEWTWLQNDRTPIN